MLGLSVIILLNLIFNVNSNLAVQRYSAVIKISIVIFKVTSLLTILCRQTDNQIGNPKMGLRVQQQCEDHHHHHHHSRQNKSL